MRIEKVGDAMQGNGCFTGTCHSLYNEYAGVFVMDNPVLFSLDSSNDVFHLIIGVDTKLLLQNIIVNGQGAFDHVFHFSFAYAILTFEQDLSAYFSRW